MVIIHLDLLSWPPYATTSKGLLEWDRRDFLPFDERKPRNFNGLVRNMRVLLTDSVPRPRAGRLLGSIRLLIFPVRGHKSNMERPSSEIASPPFHLHWCLGCYWSQWLSEQVSTWFRKRISVETLTSIRRFLPTTGATVLLCEDRAEGMILPFPKLRVLPIDLRLKRGKSPRVNR